MLLDSDKTNEQGNKETDECDKYMIAYLAQCLILFFQGRGEQQH